jgi:hypothetical protein
MNQYVAIQSQSEKPLMASCSSIQFIRTAQDFLELLALGMEHESNLFMLDDFNFVPEFYDLKTGLAGEVLQKLSNYSARLAIVGTFDIVTSVRFRELMAESNKGSEVHFAQSRDEAITWLTK